MYIADSSADYIELLRGLLEAEEDFVVVGSARRGDRVLAALSEQPVDLLVTDLLLPGLDGLSLLRELKARHSLPKTLVVSAFVNESVARAVSTLADHFLPKPCRSEDLLRHMRDIVSGQENAYAPDYEALVSRLLIDCGIQTHLNGFLYLRDGILRALEDPGQLRGVTKSLYRDIARHFGTSPACVERSMRTAIEHAWEKRSCTERRRSFGSLFEPWEKAPSNVPFLSAVTEYARRYYEDGAMGG